MARYVMIAFDDDREAEEFVAAIQRGKEQIFYTKSDGETYTVASPQQTVFVRGMWQRPTKFCTCREDGVEKPSKSWVRGEKYKWYACSQCGKASKGWAQGEHFLISLGRNLLPVSPLAPEWRGDIGPAGHWWDEEKRMWIDIFTGEPRRGPEPSERFKHLYLKPREAGESEREE